MPGGVPVATVALDGAKNAGILAVEIIGSSDSNILDKIIEYKKQLEIKVNNSTLKNNLIVNKQVKNFFKSLFFMLKLKFINNFDSFI